MGEGGEVRRVQWLLTGMEGYGVGRTTSEMARELRARSVVVRFLAVQEGAITTTLSSHGFGVDVLPSEASGRWQAAGLRASIRSAASLARTERQMAQAARQLVQAFDPDWIHLRSSRLLPFAGRLTRATGLRAYWHLPSTINRNLPFNLQALAYQAFCRVTEIYPLANSEHTARSLHASLVKVRVLYPAVDPRRFDPGAVQEPLNREALGIGRESVVFASLARLVPEKAHHLVIQALLALIEQGVDAYLVIAGGPLESAYGRSLQELATHPDLVTRVRFVGEVEDPLPWYLLSDVIVSGRIDPEPFGLTIAEAMLMERPVIAYREGGPSETIVPGVTGWLVQVPTVEGYREIMERCLADRSRWVEMGTRGRARIMGRFTVEKSVDDYLKFAADDEH